MIGIYFSGTGNTKYCLEKFISLYNSESEIISLEDRNSVRKILDNQEIIFAYPVYYSNIPKIVRDFIENNHKIWDNKNIFIIATMGLFSGDGTGVSARLFKKHGANIFGGLHLKMPDCICDVKLLKRSYTENKQIIDDANRKIALTVENLKNEKASKEGLNCFYHIAGLLGQRLWFFGKTRKYSDKIRIDKNTCMGCGHCVSVCPMKNLSLRKQKAVPSKYCTLCYRCVNQCNTQSITIFGKKVISQHSINDFL